MVQAKKRGAMTRALMTEAVQGDRSAGRLQRSHAIPEMWIWRLPHEIGVLVVGHDRNHGRNTVGEENLENPLAIVAQHRGTEIVEADEVLRRVNTHGERSQPESDTVHSEATPGR